MLHYRRQDFRLELIETGGDALLRLTPPHGRCAESWLPASALERAAAGSLDELRAALDAAAVKEPLVPGFSHDSIGRVTLEVGRRRWAEIAWEALVPDRACFVRSCPVRPRVQQSPLTFPIRILEAGGKPVVEEALREVFHATDRSQAMLNAATTLPEVAQFASQHQWPTVELLHMRELDLRGEAFAPLLRWLQPFADAHQTRLIVLECVAGSLGAARRLAQMLVERGGPAIWVAAIDSVKWHGWDGFYALLSHDRPLDWMRCALNAGELFAGAGREELLRYSGLAVAFKQPQVVNTITASVPAQLRHRRRGVQGQLAMKRIAQDAVQRAVQVLRLPTPGGAIDFRTMALAQDVRFQARLAAHLDEAGLHVPHLDRDVGALRSRGADSVNVDQLAQAIAQDARILHTLDRVSARKAVAAKLRSIGRTRPQLQFETHESEGLLPLAAKVVAARTLMRQAGARAPAPAKGSAKAPRHVNAAFFDEDRRGRLKRLPPDKARLRVGALLQFGVQIAEKDKWLISLGPTTLVEEVDRLPEGSWLEIGVTPIDFELIGDKVQALWLPACEPSALASFALRAREKSFIPGIARLRVSIFHRNNLVQSFLVAAVLDGHKFDPTAGLAAAMGVSPATIERLGAVSYLTRLEYSAASITQAGQAEGRALSIVANDNAGQKMVSVKGQELFEVCDDPNLPQAVARLRAALDRASANERREYRYTFAQQANRGDPALLLDALWDVAHGGWEVYNLLLPGYDEQAAVRQQLAAGGAIHAAHIDASGVIPWALVYDRKVFDRKTIDDPLDPDAAPLPVERAVCRASMPLADGTLPELHCGVAAGCLLHPSENTRRRAAGQPLVCEETVICPRHFWGYMVPIEVPAQQVKGVAGKPPRPIAQQIAATQPLSIAAGFNPELGFSKRHEGSLAALAALRNAQLQTPRRPGRDAVLDLLARGDPDVIYLFCHALAELPLDGGGVLGPSLDFGQGHLRVATDVLQAVDFAGKPWAHSPLVFMNGCSSAGFSPYAPSEFIKRFIQGRHAGAVIGTEVTVWEVLAEEFADRFLALFLERKSAGDALLLTRRMLLAKDNPLGLVYSLYGSSALVLA